MVGALIIGPHKIRLDDDDVWRSDTAPGMAEMINDYFDVLPESESPIGGRNRYRLKLLHMARVLDVPVEFEEKTPGPPGRIY